MAVSKYSKKPEVVDAIQYTGANLQEVLAFTEGAGVVENGKLMVMTVMGYVQVSVDYWVLKDFGNKLSIFGPDFLSYYKPGGGP